MFPSGLHANRNISVRLLWTCRRQPGALSRQAARDAGLRSRSVLTCAIRRSESAFDSGREIRPLPNRRCDSVVSGGALPNRPAIRSGRLRPGCGAGRRAWKWAGAAKQGRLSQGVPPQFSKAPNGRGPRCHLKSRRKGKDSGGNAGHCRTVGRARRRASQKISRARKRAW